MLCVVLLSVIMMKVMAPFHGMLCNILFLHLTLTRLRQRQAFYNGTANFKKFEQLFEYEHLLLLNFKKCKQLFEYEHLLLLNFRM